MHLYTISAQAGIAAVKSVVEPKIVKVFGAVQWTVCRKDLIPGHHFFPLSRQNTKEIGIPIRGRPSHKLAGC